ncbi:hypothetical protein [Metabacillus sp. cB07]|uniref:hypothetical protein n=1 Tax=Metabacillus sp. cB07 TaxID=2806989 RepID=UPI001F5C8D85|nr:hypothetical protein [Metabacillus sp. cB07]
MSDDFIITLVQKMFSFPIFFVFESIIFGYEKETLIENNIPFFEFSADGAIIKVESQNKVELLGELASELVSNGLSVFIFHGTSLVEQELIPSRKWNKQPRVFFSNVDINKVETFVDVEEVGITVFTKSNRFNSPGKISNYISGDYSLDTNSSDI